MDVAGMFPLVQAQLPKCNLFIALCIRAEEEETNQSLQDANGNVVEANDELANHIFEYVKSLFTSKINEPSNVVLGNVTLG